MKALKQTLAMAVAICMLALGALASDAGQRNDQKPPPKEKNEIRPEKKPPPPPRDDNKGGGNQNKRGRP